MDVNNEVVSGQVEADRLQRRSERGRPVGAARADEQGAVPAFRLFPLVLLADLGPGAVPSGKYAAAGTSHCSRRPAWTSRTFLWGATRATPSAARSSAC